MGVSSEGLGHFKSVFMGRWHIAKFYAQAGLALAGGAFASQRRLHAIKAAPGGSFAPPSATGRRCFIIDLANHPNIGDLAISSSELAFLDRYFGGAVVAFAQGEFWGNVAWLEGNIRPDDLIVLHGGGNMGDIYAEHEMTRCAVIDRFPEVRTIIFPQTIDYPNRRSPVLRLSQKVYGRAGRLTLFARERRSYDLMRQLYPGADVRIVPDIVVGSYMVPACALDRDRARSGVLLALRNDWERNLDADGRQRIVGSARAVDGAVVSTDTTAPQLAPPIPRDAWDRIVGAKLEEFACARAVITDRLHGMVFAALAGTPCVVLSNSNHKVRGVYEWLKSLGYVRYVENLDEVPTALEAVLACEDRSYLSPEELEGAFAPLIEALA